MNRKDIRTSETEWRATRHTPRTLAQPRKVNRVTKRSKLIMVSAAIVSAVLSFVR